MREHEFLSTMFVKRILQTGKSLPDKLRLIPHRVAKFDQKVGSRRTTKIKNLVVLVIILVVLILLPHYMYVVLVLILLFLLV